MKEYKFTPSANFYYKRALKFLTGGKNPAFVSAVFSALEMPDCTEKLRSELYFLLGSYYTDIHNFKEALRFLFFATQSKENETFAFFLICQNLINLNKVDAAKYYYEKLQKHTDFVFSGNSSRALKGYFDKNKLKKSNLKIFTSEGVELNKLNEIKNAYGLLVQFKFEEAILIMEKIANSNDIYKQEAKINLFLLYVFTGQDSKALSAISGIDFVSGDFLSECAIAIIHHRSKRPEDAQEALDRASRTAILSFPHIAITAGILGKHSQAYNLLSKLLKLNKNNINIILLTAISLFNMKQHDDAIAMINNAFSLEPKNETIRYLKNFFNEPANYNSEVSYVLSLPEHIQNLKRNYVQELLEYADFKFLPEYSLRKADVLWICQNHIIDNAGILIDKMIKFNLVGELRQLLIDTSVISYYKFKILDLLSQNKKYDNYVLVLDYFLLNVQIDEEFDLSKGLGDSSLSDLLTKFN